MNARNNDNVDRKVQASLLIIHAGSLGDCVLAIHLTQALQRHWNARATLAARSGIAKWAERRGLVTHAMSIDCNAIRSLVNENLADQHEVERFLGGFNPIISFLGDASQPIARRISHLTGDRAFHIDPRAKTTPAESELHITEQWLKQLADQGIDVPAIERDTLTDSSLPRDELRASLARRMNTSTPIVLIHPGSGGLKKCVPIELLENVARKLNARPQVTTCWMVGPDEFERFGPSFLSRLEKSAPVLYEESIERAADIVAGADLYIGHDAGMTHVAALAGVRTIAIFGPTNPHVWRPLGRHIHIREFPASESVSDWVDTLVRNALKLLVSQQLRGA